MAAAGTVIGQVHALARAQAHPDDFVESPLARVWGEPAIRVLRPLLDWSDPYTVYVTYGKIWLRCALLSPRRRTWSTDGGAQRGLSDVCGRSLSPATP
jgi:hypothetical protein